MRKIIQIEISAVPACDNANMEWETLFALCDDGTVWRLNWPYHDPNNNEWVKIKNIPNYTKILHSKTDWRDNVSHENKVFCRPKKQNGEDGKELLLIMEFDRDSMQFMDTDGRWWQDVRPVTKKEIMKYIVENDD